jgi:hypothetical protein
LSTEKIKMIRTDSSGTTNLSADEHLNERFHTLLREAAELREGRALVQSSADDAAARQESAELLALARGDATGRKPRGS